MSALHLLWRIIYNSLYLIFCLILLTLLLVTPADTIRQALLNNQRLHILIICIAYTLAIFVVAFIYLARLYVNRSVLANIPKSWIPIEKGDVRRKVRKVIRLGLSRSAAIAFESRPRVAPPVLPPTVTNGSEEKEDGQGKENKKSIRLFGLKKATTMEDELDITLPPHKAVWGDIEHYGWASPNSPDLPNLQYSTVISELPNLIEAKALTLAPPDPESATVPPMLDPEAIALLQRPENMALRDYLSRLTELGILPATHAVADFVNMYEYARYSTRPISNSRFRELMHLFAEILRTMEPLDPTILGGGVDGADDVSTSESDIDNDAPIGTTPTTPRSQISRRRMSRQISTASRATTSSFSSGGSQVRRRPGMPNRNSSQGTAWGQYRTAPTTPKSKKTAVSRSSSVNSFAQTRQPYLPGDESQGSTSSLGSVIRLSERADQTDLPFVFTLSDPP